jgi:pimeloyl-ACP methyl ester carboxylesterase
MVNINIVERFCTPPPLPETVDDRNAFADAQVEEIPFEGQLLKSYSWGTGRNILLVHGWGSRASHLAFLGRSLAKSGFHVLTFDGPAHGHSLKEGQKNTSNLFEFCRAISTVARTMLPLYAIVGHSLGAAAAAFTVAGHASLFSYKTFPERLVLISSPASVSRMIELFCRREGLEERVVELTKGLERVFCFSVPKYSVPLALNNIEANILIVHDEQDEEIPVADAFKLKEARDDACLVLTQGAGHQRILANRILIRTVKNFLTKTDDL